MAASSTFRPLPYAQVLQQVFDFPAEGMTHEFAERILAMDFPDTYAVRIETLNERANEGELTDDEKVELETYCNVSDLLAYWQSKARQSLVQQA